MGGPTPTWPCYLSPPPCFGLHGHPYCYLTPTRLNPVCLCPSKQPTYKLYFILHVVCFYVLCTYQNKNVKKKKLIGLQQLQKQLTADSTFSGNYSIKHTWKSTTKTFRDSLVPTALVREVWQQLIKCILHFLNSYKCGTGNSKKKNSRISQLMHFHTTVSTTLQPVFISTSLVPRPPLFLPSDNNTWNQEIGEKLKQGRPGSIHHVSRREVDVEGEGSNIKKIYILNLKASFLPVKTNHAKVWSPKR